MKAYSPTGSLIVATADLIPGYAEVAGVTRAEDGSLIFEYGGETGMDWNGQRPRQRGGAYESGPDLLTAVKRLIPFVQAAYGGDTLADDGAKQALEFAQVMVAAAEAPAQDLCVDENGDEWTEAELTLVEDDVDPPAPAFATVMQPEK